METEASPAKPATTEDIQTETPLHQLLRVRHDTAMPVCRQLEVQVMALISEGRIPAGATLPAERQLARALGVSRTTVQRCYNTLRERRLLRGHGRHGSIVQGGDARLLPGMDRLKGFSQEMRELGRTPSTRILEHEIITDRSMASVFGQTSTARFVKLVRLRLGDDIPLSLETAWYSLDAAPHLAQADVTGSMYQQLARAGLPLVYCDQTIEATSPTRAEYEMFGFSEPVPCLLIKRRSYLRHDVMVEYVEGVFRGDAYSYRLRLEA